MIRPSARCWMMLISAWHSNKSEAPLDPESNRTPASHTNSAPAHRGFDGSPKIRTWTPTVLKRLPLPIGIVSRINFVRHAPGKSRTCNSLLLRRQPLPVGLRGHGENQHARKDSNLQHAVLETAVLPLNYGRISANSALGGTRTPNPVLRRHSL